MKTQVTAAAATIAIAAAVLAATECAYTATSTALRGHGSSVALHQQTHTERHKPQTQRKRPAHHRHLSLKRAIRMTAEELAEQRERLMHPPAGTVPATRSAYQVNNWSGMETEGHYQGIAGEWRVPTVQATATNKYSCTWVGIDGGTPTDRSLIQVGTEEDSVDGRPRYYAWLETLPQTQTLIRYTTGALVPVQPGDRMWAYLYETSTNVWKVYEQDLTQGWTFSSSVGYVTPGLTAEWIHEATQVNGVVGQPPVFSPVTFSDLQVDIGGRWYYIRLTDANKVYLVQDHTVFATPTSPGTTTPQQFSVYYG